MHSWCFLVSILQWSRGAKPYHLNIRDLKSFKEVLPDWARHQIRSKGALQGEKYNNQFEANKRNEVLFNLNKFSTFFYNSERY